MHERIRPLFCGLFKSMKYANSYAIDISENKICHAIAIVHIERYNAFTLD